MTTTNDDGLCIWSDLPPDTCQHCRTGARTTGEDDDVPTATKKRPTFEGLRVVHPIAHQPPAAVVGARHIPDHPTTLVDYITALVDPTIHGEPFQQLQRNTDGSTTWITQRHRTTTPPLLEQLWATVEASGSTEGGVRSFSSKPSARLDSIDAANDVEHGVHAWLTRLGVVDSHDTYPDILPALRHLGSLGPSLDEPTGKELVHDVRSWWVRARVLTGWDSPAWKPDNTCPLCGVRGTLRVRLDARAGTCISCQQSWHPETIGLLADHIRAENHEDEVEGVETA